MQPMPWELALAQQAVAAGRLAPAQADVLLREVLARRSRGEAVDLAAALRAHGIAPEGLASRPSGRFPTRSPGAPDPTPASSAATQGPGAGAPSSARLVRLPSGVRPGQTVAGCRLEAELGRGGMGAVYRGVAPDGAPVAVKVLLDPGASAHARARFAREAALFQKLAQVPGIVRLLHADVAADPPALVMELVEGGDLAGLLARPTLSLERALGLLEQVCRAVHAAHELGVVHRDLKPQNVLVDADGRARVTDFGLGRDLGRETRLTASGASLGTLTYMAPEQLGGRGEIGPAADVYALGAMLFEVLTGEVPFRDESVIGTARRIVEEAPRAPSSVRPARHPDLGREHDRVCLRALAKRPEDRHPSALALARDVARLRGGGGARSLGPRAPIALAATAGLVALAAAAVALGRAGARPPASAGAGDAPAAGAAAAAGPGGASTPPRAREGVDDAAGAGSGRRDVAAGAGPGPAIGEVPGGAPPGALRPASDAPGDGSPGASDADEALARARRALAALDGPGALAAADAALAAAADPDRRAEAALARARALDLCGRCSAAIEQLGPLVEPPVERPAIAYEALLLLRDLALTLPDAGGLDLDGLATRAIELAPDRPEAYAARGGMRAHRDLVGARADLERALALAPALAPEAAEVELDALVDLALVEFLDQQAQAGPPAVLARADDLLARARALAPADPRVPTRQAMLDWARGDDAAAERGMQEAMHLARRRGGLARHFLDLAWEAIHRERFDEAVWLGQRARARDLRDPLALVTCAVALACRGEQGGQNVVRADDLRQAESSLTQAKGFNQRCDEGYLAHVWILAIEEPARATELLAVLAQVEAQVEARGQAADVEWLRRRVWAELLGRAGRRTEAKVELEASARAWARRPGPAPAPLDPGDPAALEALLARVEGALAGFEGERALRALEAVPGADDPRLRWARARALDLAGDPEGAYREVEALLAAPEGLPARARYDLLLAAYAHERMRGVQGAAARLDEAIALDPDRPEAHARRGVEAVGLGRHARGDPGAEADLRRALALDPGHAPALRGLAHLLADEAQRAQGEAREAMRREAWALLERAHAGDRDDPRTLTIEAFLHRTLRREDDERRALERALAGFERGGGGLGGHFYRLARAEALRMARGGRGDAFSFLVGRVRFEEPMHPLALSAWAAGALVSNRARAPAERPARARDALTYLHAARQMSPRAWQPYLWAAEAKAQLDPTDPELDGLLEGAFGLVPEDQLHVALEVRAMVRALQRRHEEALADARASLARAPERAWPRVIAATALDELGRPDEARAMRRR